MIDIGSHNNLQLETIVGKYSRSLRDEGHMTRWKVNVGSSKFGIDFENDISAILAFRIGDMFHLNSQVDEMRDILDCIERKFQAQCQ
jgi:hypothetical protein